MHVKTLLLIEWEFISGHQLCLLFSNIYIWEPGKQSSYHALSKTIYTVDVQ